VSLDLTRAQEKALKRAVLSGDYHLLLGAGTSLDSIDINENRLPTASALACSIAEQFDTPIEDGDLLWRIYARAVETVGEDTVYGWLRQRFWNVKPPEWMGKLARSPWSTVWTLNIDDSFEQSYKQVKSELSRPLTTVSWDDEFRLSRDLSVVHLHGCVDRDSPRRLVFSLNEYASMATADATWPLSFRDLYGVSPFVIIGARLRDEPDIEVVVSRRQPSHEAPSLYVNPHISHAAERDMRSWRLIPVRMTAEEFIPIWSDLIGRRLDEAPIQREEVMLRVGRQFRELQNSPGKAPSRHDFIGGDEPRWNDIQRDQHAELDWIQQALSDCRQLGKPGTSATSAIIYVGERLTGRSSGLLAVARELRRRSWRTFIFNDDERLDIDALLPFAADGKSVALLFDSVADIADDVAVLLRRSRELDLTITCVAVDNVDKTASIVGRLDEALLVHHRIGEINSTLTRTDATRLVDKLDIIGRLGKLEHKSDRNRIAHFQRREIFDAMAELENAPGFGRRIGELVNQVEPQAHLRTILVAALAARASRGLLIIDAARMAVVESDELVRAIQEDEALGAVLRTEDRWIVPRHRWMALEPCVKRLGNSESLNFLGLALTRLGPRLGRASQRERNATSMLVGALMTYRNVSEVFATADLDFWYESLAPTFGGWSARYWEQRAIMCRNLGQTRTDLLSRAESFALRAVSIVRDTFSLTTLGTVLLAKAANGSQADLRDYYDRAFDSFESASREDPTNLVTWLAYLKFTLGVIERISARRDSYDSNLVDRIHGDWVRILDSVALVASAGEATKKDIVNLKRQYAALTKKRTV